MPVAGKKEELMLLDTVMGYTFFKVSVQTGEIVNSRSVIKTHIQQVESISSAEKKKEEETPKKGFLVIHQPWRKNQLICSRRNSWNAEATVHW